MTLDSPAPPFEREHLGFLRWSREYQLHHDMQLPDIRPWHRLIARHDENPERFDFWHPYIGRWIEQEDAARLLSPPLQDPPPPLHFSSDTSSGWTIQPSSPIGEPLGPHSVPEPSSLILLSVAMLATWLLTRFLPTSLRTHHR